MKPTLPYTLWTVAVLLAIVVCCPGQSQPNSAAQLQIQSEILKEPRFLSIFKPEGYDSGTDRYPVLYLLDAESNLEYTAAHCCPNEPESRLWSKEDWGIL
jgi:hypothetical protein